MELLPAPRRITPTDNINEWLFETIEPWLKGRVLEVGSKSDSLSSVFVQRVHRIHLNSPDKTLRRQLRTIYDKIDTIRSVNAIDFRDPEFENSYPAEVHIFDTIIILNASDPVVISHAKYLLRKRGRLIVLAPAYTALYYGIDEDQFDCKKYNRKDILHLLTDDMEMLTTQYLTVGNSSPYRPGFSVLAIARKKE